MMWRVPSGSPWSGRNRRSTSTEAARSVDHGGGGSTNAGIPTDRGIVFIRSHADGMQSVLICCGVENGRPIHVFAIHTRKSSLDIDPAIEWAVAGPASRYTTRMVIVSTSADGDVAILRPPPESGPLMDLVGE